MDSYLVGVYTHYVGENFYFQIFFKNLNFGGILARIWAKFAPILCEICQGIQRCAWIFGMWDLFFDHEWWFSWVKLCFSTLNSEVPSSRSFGGIWGLFFECPFYHFAIGVCGTCEVQGHLYCHLACWHIFLWRWPSIAGVCRLLWFIFTFAYLLLGKEDPVLYFWILSLVPSLIVSTVAGGFRCCPILCCT